MFRRSPVPKLKSDRHYPEVTTVSQLRRHINTIQPPSDRPKISPILHPKSLFLTESPIHR
ncbi:hypothetical protein J0895_03015 [Phormidium pseudopriestleyi FRX01]|uniref:Uncharacterized protein n=1 Tax=Phormidium pseudopriestleyi FRX01 TaxID=1759528 RepID=A0ABS3FM22_9CYAN|nr:hypothetical protein [Phormidium pseudopriestleyi]MBO0348088.1 hypothetical protein [Phormidium pseudopriestleyi FRX01]